MDGTTMSKPVEWARLGFIPGQSLRIFGMRRSGNHAIINWLLRNEPSGRSVFLNNCKPAADPFDTFRSIEVNGELASSRNALKDLAPVAEQAGDGATLLMSYEDVSPAMFSPERPVGGRFDDNLITGDILIYRGFLNWVASLLKKIQANPSISLMRRNAIVLQSIDFYSLLLRQVEQADELGFTCICYDHWVQDDSYRAAVLNHLGFPLRDNSLGRVQNYGGGSSFQKEAEAPEELTSDRRWQQMCDDPEFAAILQLAAHDDALVEQLEEIFPRDAALLARIAQASAASNDGAPS